MLNQESPGFSRGEQVNVLHTCVIDGTPTDHEAPVEVREIGRVTLGLRYRGVRCDGSAIEWVERA